MTRKRYAANYGIALLLEAASFYGGFTYLTASRVPPVYRLIGVCIFFPLAALMAWWGGHVRLLAIGEHHYHYMQLFDTLPVRAFLGIFIVAVAAAVLVALNTF